MFNHPTLNPNNYTIYRKFSNDGDLNLNWYHFLNRHFGIHLKTDLTSQSLKYAGLDTNGRIYSKEIFPSSKTGRYSLALAFTYNFAAAKKLNFLISGGPQFYANRLLKSALDSSDYKFENFSGNTISHNPRQGGIGVYLGLTINYHLTDRISIFASPSYQRGFTTFRQTKIGTPTNWSVLNYNGSGPAVVFGIMFFRKKDED